MHLSALDLTSIADSDLDNAYAAAYAAMQQAIGMDKITSSTAVNDLAQEILSRLGSLSSFITGAGGSIRFPQYDAIQKAGGGGFQQVTEAQASVEQAASNLAAGAANAFKFGLGGVMVLGAAALVALYLLKKK